MPADRTPGRVAPDVRADLARCVDAIDFSDGLLITAGAGMGVDSGLPDFRGPEGFWRAYPALRDAGVDFRTIACPAAFRADPRLAWGFYGHRLRLYRETPPHAGFGILRDIAGRLRHGARVFTSNVDGQFQKAGFAPAHVTECHGSIHYLQCLDGCHAGVWPARDFMPEIDDVRGLLLNAPPRCPRCGGVARPNILMFHDGEWLERRFREQRARLASWLEAVQRLVVIEIGAGSALPAVRHFSESRRGFLIRINPGEPELHAGVRGVGLAMAALEALREISGA